MYEALSTVILKRVIKKHVKRFKQIIKNQRIFKNQVQKICSDDNVQVQHDIKIQFSFRLSPEQ